MRSSARALLLTAAVFLAGVFSLAGCYGRIKNPNEGRRIDVKAYGIESGKPALLVFGAVWCKPCMSEIPALNRASRDLSAGVQIASFLVEGPQKGVSAAPKDTELVIAPGGEKPSYRVTTDSSWNLFDGLQAQSGRALPTMVFVDRSATIVRIVQRSMHYESELLPALQALAAGAPPVVENPVPEEPPSEIPGQRKNLSFAQWSALSGNESTGTVYSGVHAGWQQGLEDFAFLEDDMPFRAAKMTAFLYADGRSYPIQGVWDASLTGCKLTVFFNRDGSYLRSEGICR